MNYASQHALTCLTVEHRALSLSEKFKELLERTGVTAQTNKQTLKHRDLTSIEGFCRDGQTRKGPTVVRAYFVVLLLWEVEISVLCRICFHLTSKSVCTTCRGDS